MTVALFFTATLCISIIGLVSLISLKRWELASGRTLLAGLRPYAHRFFAGVLMWVERVIPALARIYSRRAWRAALALVHRTTAALVLRAEQLLERTLHLLRHSTDVRRGVGEASAFLREVAEHKKQLLHTQTARVRE